MTYKGKRYGCSECSYTGTNRNILNIHKLVQHEGVTFTCDECDRLKANSKSGNINTYSLKVIYGCNEYDSMAKHKYKLKEHKQARHEGVTYGCKEYDYKATWRDRLTLHVNTKHEGLMYRCNNRVYKAIAQRSLTDHKKSKHQDVGYKCDRCDNKAITKLNLTAQKQTKP